MLMRDGNPAGTARLETMQPIPPAAGRAGAVIARSRARHTRPRRIVEARIERFLRAP
jgi:hypothetical protein